MYKYSLPRVKSLFSTLQTPQNMSSSKYGCGQWSSKTLTTELCPFFRARSIGYKHSLSSKSKVLHLFFINGRIVDICVLSTRCFSILHIFREYFDTNVLCYRNMGFTDQKDKSCIPILSLYISWFSFNVISDFSYIL